MNKETILFVTEEQYTTDKRVIALKRGQKVKDYKEIVVVPEWVIRYIEWNSQKLNNSESIMSFIEKLGLDKTVENI